jgi:hypothetical protein
MPHVLYGLASAADDTWIRDGNGALSDKNAKATMLGSFITALPHLEIPSFST